MIFYVQQTVARLRQSSHSDCVRSEWETCSAVGGLMGPSCQDHCQDVAKSQKKKEKKKKTRPLEKNRLQNALFCFEFQSAAFRKLCKIGKRANQAEQTVESLPDLVRKSYNQNQCRNESLSNPC